MNEQIRKLAEQAGFQFWEDEPWNPGDIIDWSCRYDDEFKKFAELIVRECADYVACGEFGDAGLAEELKEHFGVEE